MTVKTIQDLGKRMEAQMIETIWETLKKDIEELRYKEWWTTQYLKLKKNALEEIKSKVTEAEEWISELITEW